MLKKAHIKFEPASSATALAGYFGIGWYDKMIRIYKF